MVKIKEPTIEKSIDWTWPKLISVCLLGSIAFYSTHQINWDSIKVEHIIAQPNLNENHYNDIHNKELLRAKRSTIQDNIQKLEDNNKLVSDILEAHHKELVESNSKLPALDFSLYEPIEAVENHEIHKRAIEHFSEEEDERSASKLQKYFFEDYINVPLNSLNKIKVSAGKVSISFYEQGTQDPPNDFLGGEEENESDYYSSPSHFSMKKGGMNHLLERNFMISRSGYDNLDSEHVMAEIPQLSVKKYHVSDGTYNNDPIRYYNRDGSDQLHFLDLLAQSGAQGAYNDLEDIIDDLYMDKAPARGHNKPYTGVRYVGSELPCLQKKEQEITFDGWMARSFQPVTEAPPQKNNGGGGGKAFDEKLKEKEASGPPVGCCNGRPYSAKKRCCCRRKSYDTETEFCCVSKNGCAAFQTFSNSTENREACLNIGGNIVMHEYFDYQATSMIGWAAGKPYGPAYSQSQIERKIDNEMKERYYDLNQHTNTEESAISRQRNPANFNWVKLTELNRQLTEEAYDPYSERNVRDRTPNSRGAIWTDKETSRDHIEDLRAGYNPFGDVMKEVSRGHEDDAGILNMPQRGQYWSNRNGKKK